MYCEVIIINDVKSVESELMDYKFFDSYVESLEFEKKMLLENNTYGVTSIDYDRIKISKTYKKDDSLEKNVIDFIEKIKEIDSKITNILIKKRKIELAIDTLDSLQKEIITMRYFEGATWCKICDSVFLTKNSVLKHKDNALCTINKYFIKVGY